MNEVVMPLGWRGRKIIGGPYRKRPKTHFGVKMAAEINEPCDVDVPTRDFCTPHPVTLQMAIEQTLPKLARGEPVYVGCMGGVGRTGLFIAALAKTLGVPNPVQWTRAHYRGPHGQRPIETEEQERFIEQFDIAPLQLAARFAKLEAKLLFWK